MAVVKSRKRFFRKKNVIFPRNPFFDGPAKIPAAPFCVSPKCIRGAFSGVAATGSTPKLPRLSFLRSVQNSSVCLFAVPSFPTSGGKFAEIFLFGIEKHLQHAILNGTGGSAYGVLPGGWRKSKDKLQKK